MTVSNGPGRRGVLRLAHTSDIESLDPGDTYYAYVWNFQRLLSRSLVMYRPAAGRAGQELVPDLAEGPGVPADGGLRWTYRLRAGVRFEDGAAVTAHDVKRAIVRRNLTPGERRGGPTYFRRYLSGPEAIEVPDPRTIEFHLTEPFAWFDFLAALPTTMPVPPGAGPGDGEPPYPAACGPYRVEHYVPRARLELAPNPYWDPASDPVRQRLLRGIVVELGLPASEIDRRLIEGDLDVDLSGMGVQPDLMETIMADPRLRGRADNPVIGYTWMYAINPKASPLEDVRCRRAIQLATDKRAMQDAYGGSLAGDIATAILPPTMGGHRPSDLYPCGPDQRGDVAAARALLAEAGYADGFPVRIAAREDRRKEHAAAQALAASLVRAGMDAEVVPLPSSDYFTSFAGVPEYVHTNRIGIIMFGWVADFPDGYGFLQQIVDGRAIKPRGNHNFAEIDLPEVNDLLDAGARTRDRQAREAVWAEIDRRVLEEALLCPYLYPRSVLLRGPRVRDARISAAYGMYDLVALSVVDGDG